ncbi:DUF4097 family beta strand repeat-containing protein [Solibacillus silvestris]|uniref:DUF4097 family beta strand repeat-containing protein n=1 Tax=Solibacillus silvestris TaxID=76853 RepID=UPI003F81B5C1
MNEQQFLDLLDHHLERLQLQEREDIRRDFEEYFENGRAEGKTTEEIVHSFGDIKELAAELLASYDEEDFAEKVAIMKNDEAIPYRNVKVEADGVNVLIVPTDANEAMIEAKDKDDLTEVSMHIKNDTLFIDIKRQEQIRRFWFITIIGSINTIDAVVYLPKKQYEKITISNDNGRIKVSETFAQQFYLKSDNGRILTDHIEGQLLDAHSDNGRVVLAETKIENVKASSSNGRIIVENVIGRELQLDSDNGRIELKDAEGEINAKSRNGRIIAQLKTVQYPLNFASDNGQILLSTEGKLQNVEIETWTAWGSVSIYNEKAARYAHGTKEHMIQLKTSNGKITVEDSLAQ